MLCNIYEEKEVLEQAKTDTCKKANTENEGFYDSVGGYHDNGVGYSPTGEWCGECCKNSCEDCPVAKSSTS